MATVRDATLGLLRELGMTTIFGNPGSTELPLLRDLPEDFRYVLALHESSALGMAEGYARLGGNAALVNLHTAPGLGNAMGAMVTAFHNRTPLVVTAGQQHRGHISLEPMLKGELVELAKPYVKRSHEPYSAEDVPRELLRAYHTAMTAPQGPVFLSIPMDDLDADYGGSGEGSGNGTLPVTRVSYRTAPDPVALGEAAAVLMRAERPAIVAGPGVARSFAAARVAGERVEDGFEGVVALAERLKAPVWQEGVVALAAFPQRHPLFMGYLPLAQKLVAKTLAPFDCVLVLGCRVFPYYPYLPGPVVQEGTEVILFTDDPQEAAGIPVGRAVLGDVGLAVSSLSQMLPEAPRAMPEPAQKAEKPEASEPMSVAYVMDTLAGVLPQESVVADESTSSKATLRKYVLKESPESVITSEAGGLGFCMPASVGAKLARPEKTVVCVIGDGSSLYSVQSLWTAATYGVAVAFVVVNNRGYSILKSFRNLLGIGSVPGLDLPGLDLVGIASGFGVPGERVESPEGLVPALERALSAEGPYLVDALVSREVPPLVKDG